MRWAGLEQVEAVESHVEVRFWHGLQWSRLPVSDARVALRAHEFDGVSATLTGPGTPASPTWEVIVRAPGRVTRRLRLSSREAVMLYLRAVGSQPFFLAGEQHSQ